jgi:hypothetical protein
MDAGLSWTTSNVGLTWDSFSGQPDALFFTPTTGWAIANVEQVPAGSCRYPACNDVPVLEGTADGGKTWSPVDFNQ